MAQQDPMFIKMSNSSLLPDLYVTGDVVRCNEVFGLWCIAGGYGVEVNEDGSAIVAAPAGGAAPAPPEPKDSDS